MNDVRRSMGRTLAARDLLLAARRTRAETGTALKADDIKAEPFRDAKSVGSSPRATAWKFWPRRAAGCGSRRAARRAGCGCCRVRRGRQASQDAAKEAGGIAGLATGRAGTGQVVSTTGVRGLSEEELKDAKFSEDR